MVVLFVANFLLERVSILPNLSISFSTALVIVWLVLAWRAGVVSIAPRRLALWLVAAGASALLVVAQLAWVQGVLISPTSWLFWMVSWLPVVARISAISTDVFLRTMRALAWTGVAISGLSGVFLVSQLLGVPYRDLVGDLIPDSLEVGGFVIAYPVAWDSPIFKSNAWFALEPSFLSFMLGICAVCALVARMRMAVFAAILVGILTTFAGSGLAIVGVAVLLMVVAGHARAVRGPLLGGAALVLLGFLTPLREVVYSRAGELGQGGTSASLRVLEGYVELWPKWTSEFSGVLFGYGAGSSRDAVESEGVLGLLVPNVAKMLFDYGLFVGIILVALIVVAFTRSPAPALGMSLLASTLLLQAASPPLLVPIFLAVTWWGPTTLRISGAQSPADGPAPADRAHGSRNQPLRSPAGRPGSR